MTELEMENENLKSTLLAVNLRRSVVTDLQKEVERLREENKLLTDEKSSLQTELLHASDYIL